MRPPKKTNKINLPPSDFQYLAKTIKLPDGSLNKGLDVLSHCKIVGLVAAELIKRIPSCLSADLFPPGSELVAASHDLGKVSPGFQGKIYASLKETHDWLKPNLDRLVGGHAAVSEAALRDVSPLIAGIAGRHHGLSPTSSGLPLDENYGGEFWQLERLKIIENLKNAFHCDWPKMIDSFQTDALSGLTTVADWIGSGLNDFPSKEAISEALNHAGFIVPFIRPGLSFNDVFPPYKPKPIQQALIDRIKGPGVYVLEAPMGLGKTEAALYAAYKVLENNKATGIYFALPTQLTSDKMVDRMNRFLDVILDSDSSHRKALLLHGTAWLQKTRMFEDCNPGYSWFDHRKRGLLAPFAVGTIDQALMAVMNVKHGFVRSFGLAGKIVILDEVHSYDCYTGTLLDYLVKSLQRLQCTVIILSATLVLDRRAELIDSPKQSFEKDGADYPLVTAMVKDTSLHFASTALSNPDEVFLTLCDNNDKAIDEALFRAERGEQVLWIENTVDEAQKRFKIIGAKSYDLGIECGLIHSRFLKTDRNVKESYWVNIYGKNGKAVRGKTGRILVGTQVLEQSLDIDGDFLVSHICPTDMLLQRIGRLWRHRDNDTMRPRNAHRDIWILSPQYQIGIQDVKAFEKTANVYSPYILCRTLEVWKDRKTILLPHHMRDLIEKTYSERNESDMLARMKNELLEKKDSLRRHARIGLSKAGKTLPESKANTRYSETESIDVFLFKNLKSDKEGFHIKLLDGSRLLLKKGNNNGNTWRKISAQILDNTVSVPEYLAPVFSLHNLEFLKEYVYIGNDEERPFRAATVTDSGDLIGIGHEAVHEKYRLCYNSTLGFLAYKETS
ncbi:MAG: CRISPR-associated helicase Cas3' [Pseudomonadota bacterium]